MIKINKDKMTNLSFIGTAYRDENIGRVNWEEFLNSESVYIGIHNGRFHADDVFCVALLYLMKYSYFRYVKCNNAPYPSIVDFINHSVIRASTCADLIELGIKTRPYIICDIRGGHYDHHQINQDHTDHVYNFDWLIRDYHCDHPKVLEDNHRRLCSFASLWVELGKIFKVDLSALSEEQKACYDPYMMDSNVWRDIMEELCIPISLVDTNGSEKFSCTYNKIISDLNLTEENVYNDLPGKDPNFTKAVEMAYAILTSAIISAQNKYSAIAEAYEKCSFEENENYIAYLQIPEVNNPDDEVKLGIPTLNELIIPDKQGESATRPYFLFNPNPATRDGCCRLVMSKWGKLDVESIKKHWSKYVFIHPDGFLMTFSNKEDAKEFIEKLNIHEYSGDKIILGV